MITVDEGPVGPEDLLQPKIKSSMNKVANFILDSPYSPK